LPLYWRALRLERPIVEPNRAKPPRFSNHERERGYPGVVLFYSARVLFNSARVPTRAFGPCRSKNTALGVFRTPEGVLGTCFALLVHVDWGIFGQAATRANGHLGFGVFIASQPVLMTWQLTFTMHCSAEAPVARK
jgi:hypothetical protein